jgi:hypothetical protein
MRESAKWLDVYRERETLMEEKQPEYDSWMWYVPSLSVARQHCVS